MNGAELAIVIPYRASTPERERIFEWTSDRYRALFPAAELILGEMTSDCDYFCRAEAINNGVRHATRPWLLIADADAIAFAPAIEQAVTALQRQQHLARVFPYNDYHHLTCASTNTVLCSKPRTDPREHTRLEVFASYPNSTSGLIVLNRDTFWESGGFDERMRGWGPEDQAWDLAVDTLCGPSARITGWDLYHLFHDVAPGHRHDNPHYPESDRLWARYKQAAGDSDAMRRLVTRIPA